MQVVFNFEGSVNINQTVNNFRLTSTVLMSVALSCMLPLMYSFTLVYKENT